MRVCKGVKGLETNDRDGLEGFEWRERAAGVFERRGSGR